MRAGRAAEGLMASNIRLPVSGREVLGRDEL